MTATLPEDVAAVVTIPALLTVARAAQILACSPRTLRRRIAEGSLPAVIDHGRTLVRADDLRRYIDGLERVGSPRSRACRRPPRAYDFLAE